MNNNPVSDASYININAKTQEQESQKTNTFVASYNKADNNITLNKQINKYKVEKLAEIDKYHQQAISYIQSDNHLLLIQLLSKKKIFFIKMFNDKSLDSLINATCLVRAYNCLPEILNFIRKNDISLSQNEQSNLVDLVKTKSPVAINLLLGKYFFILDAKCVYNILIYAIKVNHKNIILKAITIMCNQYKWYLYQNQLNPIYDAISCKNNNSLVYLLDKMPEFLLQKNINNTTPVIYSILNDASESLFQLLRYKKSIETLSWTDNNNNNAVEIAIKNKKYECLKVLIDEKPDIINAYWDIIKNSCYHDSKIVKIIFSNEFIKSKVMNMKYFPEAPNKEYSIFGASLSVTRYEHTSQLSSVNKSKLITVACNTPLNKTKNSINLANEVSEYLNIESTILANYNSNILATVKQKLACFTQIAIYVKPKTYYEETNFNFSYQDEETNSSISLIDSLIELGATNINLIISPPYKNIKKIYNAQKLDYLNMLSHSLKNLDCNNIKHQKIIRNGCNIAVGFLDDKYFINKNNSIINFKLMIYSGLIFTFSTTEMYKELYANHVINIKPFLVKKQLEQIHTDIIINKLDNSVDYNVIPLKNNEHSLIPEQKINIPIKYNNKYYQKTWIKKKLIRGIQSAKAGSLATKINFITDLVKQDKIMHGIIYEFNHKLTANCINQIVEKWFVVLMELLKTHNKSIVVSIVDTKIHMHVGKLLNDKVIFMNDENINNLKYANNIISQKKIIITTYPTLPKEIFQHLAVNSNIPALVENSNTTSFLVQNGIPYLSLLPNAEDKIAKNIGDPLQAFLIEALSYKLMLSAKNLLVLSQIYMHVKEKQFDLANKLIISIRTSQDDCYDKDNLNFLWAGNNNYNKKKYLITVVKLIHKGDRLGEIEYNTLLQALNTDASATADYIKQIANFSSKEYNHINIIKEEVNANYNNAVVLSLYQLLQAKNLI